MRLSEIEFDLMQLRFIFNKLYNDEAVLVGVSTVGFHLQNSFYLELLKQKKAEEKVVIVNEYIQRSFFSEGIEYLTLYSPTAKDWKEKDENTIKREGEDEIHE